MSLNASTENRIREWHRMHGGFQGRLAGHALKSLEEMVELCFACGADENEIVRTVTRECSKQLAKEREDQGKTFTRESFKSDIEEEYADVMICLVILAFYAQIMHEDQVVRRKIPILEGREWEATKDGVLVRPERIKDYE